MGGFFSFEDHPLFDERPQIPPKPLRMKRVRSNNHIPKVERRRWPDLLGVEVEIVKEEIEKCTLKNGPQFCVTIVPITEHKTIKEFFSPTRVLVFVDENNIVTKVPKNG